MILKLPCPRAVFGIPGANRASPLQLTMAGVLCGLIYGAGMGSYGGLADDRWPQLIYSALKVPMLLGLTFVLSLPSFFVLSSLLGVRGDFGRVMRGLTHAQAGVCVVLASLTPYTLMIYASGISYAGALLFNAAMFGAASACGQLLLLRRFRPLIAKNPRHRWSMRLWLVIYAFVGVQMGWVLRPFVGSPSAPPRFLRSEGWGNAYLVIIKLLRDVLGLSN